MAQPLKIGTRDSQLAVYQAKIVLDRLQVYGVEAELFPIKSEGDIDLATPLYEMGIQGIFTKSLDAALLAGRIDLAVHSLKDVPTRAAAGLDQAAVLERGNYRDVLVKRLPDEEELPRADTQLVIATGSIRRRAQWLHRYPAHQMENLRGNVPTRLKKLAESEWYGAIFAAAGLERINLKPRGAIELEWMLPAPAQGAIVVMCRDDDHAARAACAPLHHDHTALCVKIERDFLRTLLGGCSTPVGALAEIEGEELFFRGNIFSPDGKRMLEAEKILPAHRADKIGVEAAKELLQNGAADLIRLQ